MSNPAAKKTTSARVWQYFRAGGMIQVKLDSGADLAALSELDKKLWAALACPATGLHCDTRTLGLIDSDNDGRVRAPDLVAAVQWTLDLLKNPDDLLRKSSSLDLTAINEECDEGKAVTGAARELLAWTGKNDVYAVTVEETQAALNAYKNRVFNGDGIITPACTDSGPLQTIITDIMTCMGSDTDLSGTPGISREKADLFFGEAKAYAAWIAAGTGDPSVFIRGEATVLAFEALAAIEDKVEDFFARCRLASYDNRSENALNLSESDYAAIATKLLSLDSVEIAALPLARVEAGRSLPLDATVNPAWSSRMVTFRVTTVIPLMGDRDSLTEAEWVSLKNNLAPYRAHSAARPHTRVEALGIPRIQSIATENRQADLNAVFARDTAVADTFTALAALEKLLLFHRDLYRLCCNFVNFYDFYSGGGNAIFRVGTLYIDRRSCELCLRVDDIGKHAAMAAMAGTYLAYCACERKVSQEKMNIVAAITDGDADTLMPGRNGIFYDRNGKDWDATIVRIIDNPISLRQAFWSPYKNFVRMIEQQIAKRAAAAQTDSHSRLESAAVSTAQADKTIPVLAPKKMDVGVVAAIGVAAGAIGTFLATLMGYFAGIFKFGPLAIIAAIAGVIMLISGPSLILAGIKLRKRNLGPILDANGWAINSQAKINVPFGAALTRIAKIPLRAQRHLRDPFAQKKSVWPIIIITAILIYAGYATLDHFGYVFTWSKGRIGVECSPAPAKP